MLKLILTVDGQDIIALVVQAAGGALAAGANTDSGTSLVSISLNYLLTSPAHICSIQGANIMLGGIVFQLGM